jgi:hypothetical protein
MPDTPAGRPTPWKPKRSAKPPPGPPPWWHWPSWPAFTAPAPPPSVSRSNFRQDVTGPTPVAETVAYLRELGAP